jgi:hypothetical protein
MYLSEERSAGIDVSLLEHERTRHAEPVERPGFVVRADAGCPRSPAREHPRRAENRQPRPTVRPSVEALEDRQVPSATAFRLSPDLFGAGRYGMRQFDRLDFLDDKDCSGWTFEVRKDTAGSTQWTKRGTYATFRQMLQRGPASCAWASASGTSAGVREDTSPTPTNTTPTNTTPGAPRR